MALINCPECKKEISDKVKACPNCGFPLSTDDDNVERRPQQVEVSYSSNLSTYDSDVLKYYNKLDTQIPEE